MRFTIEADDASSSKSGMKPEHVKAGWPVRPPNNTINASGGMMKGVSGIGPSGKSESPVGSRIKGFVGAPPGTMNSNNSKSPRDMSNPINRTTGTKYNGNPVCCDTGKGRM